MAWSIEEVNTIIIFILLGGIGWEFFEHLPFDWVFVHHAYKRQVSFLAVAQYFSCKVTMLAFATLAAVIQVRADSQGDRFLLVNAANYAGGFSIWFASSVFVLRAIALEGGIKRPLSIVLAASAIGNGNFLFTRFQPRNLLDPDHGFEFPTLATSWSCHHSGLEKHYAVWPWTTFAVDLIAFFIMLRALFGQVGKPAIDSGFGHVLVRDGLVYLLYTGSLSLGAGIYAVIYNEGKASDAVAVGLPVLLCSTGGAVIATCSIRRLFIAREKLRAPHDFFDLQRTGPSCGHPPEPPTDPEDCAPSLLSRRRSLSALAMARTTSSLTKHHTWPVDASSRTASSSHAQILQMPVLRTPEAAATLDDLVVAKRESRATLVAVTSYEDHELRERLASSRDVEQV